MLNKKLIENNIPDDLKDEPQWVCWKLVLRKGGKLSKIPIDPNTGKVASIDNLNTWGSFKRAVSCFKAKNFAGIGFVFTDDDDFIGIDLDNCRNPETGEFEQWAWEIIEAVNSYTEISPSGKGVKIFASGRLPKGKHRIGGLPSFGTTSGGIEIYDINRYFAVTGNIIPGSNRKIRKIVQTLKKIYQQYFPEENKIEPPVTPEHSKLCDDEVIAKAMNARNGDKFRRLMEGNINDYNNDASRADQALTCTLAFWTGGNAEQIDRIFRQSKLFRPKWDEKHYSDGRTYGQETIRKGIEYCNGKFYQSIPIKPSEILKALEDGEQGDANLFIKIHRNRLCYDHSSAKWYLWTGNFWIEDFTNQALASIMNLVHVYQRERDRLLKHRSEATTNGAAAPLSGYNETLIEKLNERISKLKSQPKREHILKLACAGQNSLGIIGSEWDTKPWTLACSNGTLSLKGEEAEFREGSPDDYIKLFAPTEWQGIKAAAPLWKKTLKEIFSNDRELIKHLHMLLGYALSGSCQEHVFIIFTGIGRNGKTTIIELIKHVLGALSDPIPSETLLKQTHSTSGASPRADLIKLRGLRMAWASESDEGRRFNAGLLKQLTGNDTITARAPYGRNMVSFAPTHTIFFLTNHMPHISVDEYAFWERIHVIPFNVSFVASPKEFYECKADPELLDKLKSEAPGILAWLVRGCLRWQKHGLQKPASIQEAIKNYRQVEDVIGRFLKDCCKQCDGGKVKANALYNAYERWCDDNDTECWSQTRFGKEIGKRLRKQTSNGVYYSGIALKKGDKLI